MLQRYEKICTRAIIKENFFLIGNWGAALLLFRGRTAFGNVAFDNEVVLIDDFASSLRQLMSPLSQK